MGRGRFARQEFWDMTVPMLMMPQPTARTRFADWPFALKSIIGFWCFYTLTVVVRAFLGTDPWTTLENKLVVIGIGVLITGLIYAAISTFATGGSIRRKAIIAGLCSVAASLVMGVTLVMIEDWMAENKEEFRFQAGAGVSVDEQ